MIWKICQRMWFMSPVLVYFVVLRRQIPAGKPFHNYPITSCIMVKWYQLWSTKYPLRMQMLIGKFKRYGLLSQKWVELSLSSRINPLMFIRINFSRNLCSLICLIFFYILAFSSLSIVVFMGKQIRFVLSGMLSMEVFVKLIIVANV